MRVVDTLCNGSTLLDLPDGPYSVSQYQLRFYLSLPPLIPCFTKFHNLPAPLQGLRDFASAQHCLLEGVATFFENSKSCVGRCVGPRRRRRSLTLFLRVAQNAQSPHRDNQCYYYEYSADPLGFQYGTS